MSQTRPLIDTLKQELRKQRITYKQVSEALGLSETSVKRLFSEEAFSIKRLEKVCGAVITQRNALFAVLFSAS